MKNELCRICEKLKDVPQGTFVEIRHPLNRTAQTETVCRDCTDDLLPDSHANIRQKDTDAGHIPVGVKFRTETYELYPGIKVSFHCCLADQFRFHHRHGTSVLSNDHCRFGRIGWQMKDGLSLYFGSGDLSFHFTDKCSDSEIALPLGYYEGLTVLLDLKVLNEEMPELLKDAGIDANALCRKFCGEKETAALPANSRIEHIFSEVYDLPERMKLPCLKLKCQELLLFLDMTEPAEGKTVNAHYSDQVAVIKEIHDRITSRPDRRYTIEELAKEYLINTAALKSTFKAVYGMPMASYMKQFRMAKSARLLRETSLSIADIALAVGYESQSKFSAAFKDVMKILPTDYRRQYRKQNLRVMLKQ